LISAFLVEKTNASFMIYYDKFDGIHTYKGFFYNPFTNGKNFVFPYLNVGVTSHPLNPTERLRYLNQCYLVLLDSILVGPEEQVGLTATDYLVDDNGRILDFVGGVYIDMNEKTDIGFRLKNFFVQTDDILAKMRDEGWHMDEINHSHFSSYNSLPQNLKAILGNDVKRLF